MRQYKLIMLGILLLGMGCSRTWDDHYDRDQATVTSQSVWEYLRETPRYASFVKLLEDNGCTKVLQSEREITLWVPSVADESLLASMPDSLRRLTLLNHITRLAYTSREMKDGERLSAYSGKKLGCYSDDGVSYRIDGQRLVKTDMICRDGVVHEVQGMLLLQSNLKEYLGSAPEYSLMRTMIDTRTDSVFDLSLSTPTGEFNELGKPIYDSVFVVSNSYYRNVPLHNENRTFTLLLTPDWVLQEKIDAHYLSIRNFTGDEPVGEDSVMLNSWLVNTLAYDGTYTLQQLTSDEPIVALPGKTKYLPGYQKFGNRQALSNGMIWQIEDLCIPRSIIFQRLNVPAGESYAMYDMYDRSPASFRVSILGAAPDQVVAAEPEITTDRNKGMGLTVKPVEDNDTPFDVELSWTLGKTNLAGTYRQIVQLPGEYELKLKFTTAMVTNDFEIYLNGSYVGRITQKEFKDKDTYEVKKLVKIGEKWALSPTQIALRTVGGTGGERTLSLISSTFKPTAENY